MSLVAKWLTFDHKYYITDIGVFKFSYPSQVLMFPDIYPNLAIFTASL
jgi:hypothetical protein